MKKSILSLCIAAVTTSAFAQTQEPFPNGTFENWTAYPAPNNNIYHPDQFQSLNSATALLGIVTCVKAPSPNAHGGNLAAKLKSASFASAPHGTIQGMMTTGTINIQTQAIDGGMAFTSRPDSIVVWLKYTPALNTNNAPDTGYVEILLLNSAVTDTVGRGRINVYSVISNYTRFAAAINYFKPEAPGKLRAIINSSSGYSPVANSELFVDDAQFIYVSNAINEANQVSFQLFPNPVADKITLTYNEMESGTITLSDINGKLVRRKLIDNREVYLDVSDLVEGTYLYSISTASGKTSSGQFAVKR